MLYYAFVGYRSTFDQLYIYIYTMPQNDANTPRRSTRTIGVQTPRRNEIGEVRTQVSFRHQSALPQSIFTCFCLIVDSSDLVHTPPYILGKPLRGSFMPDYYFVLE